MGSRSLISDISDIDRVPVPLPFVTNSILIFVENDS
jgi:hypothetical protein